MTTAAVAAVAAVVVLLVGGCVGNASQSPQAGGATPAIASGAPDSPTTTATDWGTIWDSLPPAFPVYPSAEPVDAPAGPSSATLTVPNAVQAAILWWRAALEQAGYSTSAVSGPLEDGSMVIDSAGSGDCRAQVTIAPTGGTTTATVLVGATCPYR